MSILYKPNSDNVAIVEQELLAAKAAIARAEIRLAALKERFACASSEQRVLAISRQDV